MFKKKSVNDVNSGSEKEKEKSDILEMQKLFRCKSIVFIEMNMGHVYTLHAV